MFLLVYLVWSSYHHVIFNILTGQIKDVTELKLPWPVNMTSNSSQFIFSPETSFQ